MELRHDPFPLVFERGDEATGLACLVLFGLMDAPRARAYLVEMVKRQRSDGAFPSHLDPEEWGMRETVRTALLLLEVGLTADEISIDGAGRFVLGHQNGDKGWSENAALEFPPKNRWLSGRESITWLTADAVDLLRRTGRGESSACRRALAWLRRMQTTHGGWPSVARDVEAGEKAREDPDATAQITFLMGEVFGENDAVCRRGRDLFERYLDHCARDAERGYRIRRSDGQRAGLDVYHLTHLLLSWSVDPPRRFRAGYDVRDPRVRRLMEALIDLQRDDGGWRPFFADESSSAYTVLAVRALILSGMIARDDRIELVNPLRDVRLLALRTVRGRGEQVTSEL